MDPPTVHPFVLLKICMKVLPITISNIFLTKDNKRSIFFDPGISCIEPFVHRHKNICTDIYCINSEKLATHVHQYGRDYINFVHLVKK